MNLPGSPGGVIRNGSAGYPPACWEEGSGDPPQANLVASIREIRRRRGVVGIFPNREAIIHLIGAVLGEHNDECMQSCRYMSVGVLRKAPQADIEDGDQQLGETRKNRVLVQQLAA